MARRILIADDEARIREVVQFALERAGFEVDAVADGADAVRACQRDEFDLVVLDVMMPGTDGLDACRSIRQSSNVPVLFLSARSDEIDRVVGLEIGADDYLTKPFSTRELVARVRAILRRASPASEAPAAKVLTHGPVTIDEERHRVRCEGAVVDLTPTEFGLLAALYTRPGVVLSRSQLMERAYRFDNHVTERTIDTHVRRVRAKFRETGFDPIATVHGVGYKAPETESGSNA